MSDLTLIQLKRAHDAALEQIAAESSLDPTFDEDQILLRLQLGNNPSTFPVTDPDLPGKLRMTLEQAKTFVDRYDIIDAYQNDATGFSAVALRDTGADADPTNDRVVIAVRSTELLNDTTRDVGADVQIFTSGFAFDQILSAQDFLARVRPQLQPDEKIDLVGYSLSGNVVRTMAAMYPDLINQGSGGNVVFNATGLGEFSDPSGQNRPRSVVLQEMMSLYRQIEADPNSATNVPVLLLPLQLTAIAAPPIDRTDPSGNVYPSPRNDFAEAYVQNKYTPFYNDFGTTVSEPAFVQYVGVALSGFDAAAVANSGSHPVPVGVAIEGQPVANIPGVASRFEYLNTHSLTLIADSLRLQILFKEIDPNLSMDDIQTIFQASSATSASTLTQTAEGDTLEKALDTLRKLFLGPTLDPLTLPSPNDPGSFGNIANRTAFYNALAAVETALNGQTYQIVSLVSMPVEMIKGHALLPGETGTAYRYAVKNLNPFVVVGSDYTQFHNPGDLDLYDPTTGNGSITLEYLKDRVTFLEKKNEVNWSALSSVSGSLSLTHYKDNESGYEIGSSLVPIPQMIFGNATDEVIDGSDFWGDRLYGGDGADTIYGNFGDDYIEGNEGNDMLLSGGSGTDTILGGQGDDLLEGGSGNDILDGGLDNDIMKGGAGLDRYISNFGGDTIEDLDGNGVVEFDGKVLLGGLRHTGDPANVYHSADGTITLTKSGADLLVTGSGPLTIKNFNFTNGALGIKLLGEAAYAVVTRTEFQKIDHYIQVGNDPAGNPLYEPVYAVFFDDGANDTRNGTPQLGGLTTPLGDDHNLIYAAGGNDTIVSGAGDDQLYGEGDSDEIYGGLGNDRLYGGAGNDELFGDNVAVSTGGGDDFLDGGEGNDVVQGGAGRDIVFGGIGDDIVNGDEFAGDNSGAFNDYVDGGDGNDFVHGGAGSDVLIGGADNDILVGDWAQSQDGTPEAGGNDSLDGGAGRDQLFGVYGDDLLSGGTGDDLVNGQDGSDVLYGGEGDDTISGDLRIVALGGGYDTNEHRAAGGDDLLFGEAGVDMLYGGEGDDMLFGGTGNDTLYGEYNANLLSPFDPLKVMLTTLTGNDALFGDEGNDSLYGGNGDDSLYGGSGNDTLEGGAGNDFLDGGDGVDSLHGGDGMDLVHGGAGNDRLTDFQGGDTLYGDDGDDFLFSAHESLNTGNSTLIGGLGNDSYEIDSLGDIVLEEAGAGIDTVRSLVSYTLPNDVENLTLAGGSVGTGNALDNVMTGGVKLEGLGGNDTLQGGVTLDGGTGDDTLINGRHYLFALGDGHDRIQENDPAFNSAYLGNENTLSFEAGVVPSDMTWVRTGNDLVLTRNGDADQIIISSFYDLRLDPGGYFLAGVTVPPEGSVFTSSGGLPTYVAPSRVEIVQFADGTLWHADHFGAPLLGDFRADIYDFGRGSGEVTVLDLDVTQSNVDREQDRILIGAGVSPSDLTIARTNGDDLALSIDGTNDRLTIQSFFKTVTGIPPFSFSGFSVAAYRIEQVQFTDGTLWTVTDLSNRISTFVGTPGADTLFGNQLDNLIQGLSGDDYLSGQSGDDVLDGGAGSDRLFGDTGNDTYLFGRGGGQDILVSYDSSGAETEMVRLGADVLPSDVTIQVVGTSNDLVLRIIGTSDQLLLDEFLWRADYQIDQLVFGDGTVWDSAMILDRALGLTLTGTDASNTLRGSVLGDVLTGLGGNDLLIGNAGDDHLAGGLGDDVLSGDEGDDTYVFNLGDGADTIYDEVMPGEANRILFGGGITIESVSVAQSGTTLTITVDSYGDRILLEDFDPLNHEGSLVVSTLAFADGNSVNLGDLFPPNHAPTVTAPIADQTAAEDSAFTLTIPITTFDDEDLIHSDVLAYGSTLADGNPLPTWLSFNPTIRTFTGTPGAGDAGSLQIAVTATDSANLSATDTFALIISGPLPQTLIGTAGNDILTGGRGDDTLTGLAGNDRLNGGQGHDLLDGGTGTDTMVGGTGNDIYVVNVAGDVVTEMVNEGIDTVQSSITYTLGANVENLTLMGTSAINGMGNSLDNILTGNSAANVLTGGAGNDTYVVGAGDMVGENVGAGIDTVVSAVTWTLGSHVENLTLTGTMNINGTGSSGNNVLIGNSGNNALDGGSGNDTVDGGEGSDRLLGGSGDDMLWGGLGDDMLNAGSGNDVLNGGDGIDTLDGGSGDDQLLGGAGNDALTGGSGADQFTGGTGNDTMTGGSGNDLYNFARGDGQDTINDTDPFPGNQDRALFGATINPLDLVIGRQANDLRLTIYGSSDQITVQNWYGGTTNQIETLQAGNGQMLLSTQVDQLIQAMAGFTTTTGLSWGNAIEGGGTVQQQAQFQGILAASWQ